MKFLAIVFSLLLGRALGQICSIKTDRLNSFLEHKKIELGRGGWGQVHGDERYAIKTFNIDDDEQKVKVVDLELNNLIRFQNYHDIIHVQNESCFCKVNGGKVEIQFKMDRMKGNLEELYKIQHQEFLSLVSEYNAFLTKAKEGQEGGDELQAKELLKEKQIEDLYLIYKLNQLFKISAPVKRMHDLVIGHFDLKPANFLYMNLFQLVLGDLGTVVEFVNVPTGVKVGTELYFSTEKNTPNAATEIYTLTINLVASIYELSANPTSET